MQDLCAQKSYLKLNSHWTRCGAPWRQPYMVQSTWLVCVCIVFFSCEAWSATVTKECNFDVWWRFRTIVTEETMAAVVVNKELLTEAVQKISHLYDTSKSENKIELVSEIAWKSVCSEVFKKDYKDEVNLCEVGSSLLISFVYLIWFSK